MTHTTRPLRCRRQLHGWLLRVRDTGLRYHECALCMTFTDDVGEGSGGLAVPGGP